MCGKSRRLFVGAWLFSLTLAACGGGGGGGTSPVNLPSGGGGPTPGTSTGPSPSSKPSSSPSQKPGGSPSPGKSPTAAPSQTPVPTPSSTIPPTPPPSGADWDTWGNNAQRWSSNDAERTLSPATVSGLTLKWTFGPYGKRISDTQPLVASNVQPPFGNPEQIVYVGDDASDLYAVSAATGQLVWNQTFGVASTACGTGSDGITSTPVIDRATNRIYVLDGLATLRALDLGSGAESPNFPPVTVYQGTDANNITWSALLLSADGSQVYLPTSSHSDTENCGTFFGTVNSVNTLSQTVTTFQAVTQPSQYYGNGIWSWGGESLDPDTGNLYAGVGNSWGTLGETGANSDSVLELTGSLNFVADEQPEKNLANDLDIGTTPVVYDDQGYCAAFMRKDGNAFTVDRMNLQNLSYQSKLYLGNTQLATPAYDPATHALYFAAVPGLTKVAAGPNCTAAIVWQTPIGEKGGWASVPAVANGVVYVAGGAADNVLYAIDAASGEILWTSGTTISGPIVAEPTVANGQVYATSWDGHLYAFGLQGSLKTRPPVRRRP